MGRERAQAYSVLSIEPDAGLNCMTRRSKAGRLTNNATQVSQPETYYKAGRRCSSSWLLTIIHSASTTKCYCALPWTGHCAQYFMNSLSVTPHNCYEGIKQHPSHFTQVETEAQRSSATHPPNVIPLARMAPGFKLSHLTVNSELLNTSPLPSTLRQGPLGQEVWVTGITEKAKSPIWLKSTLKS